MQTARIEDQFEDLLCEVPVELTGFVQQVRSVVFAAQILTTAYRHARMIAPPGAIPDLPPVAQALVQAVSDLYEPKEGPRAG